MPDSPSRRRILKTSVTTSAAARALAAPAPTPSPSDAGIYTRLGIRPVINGVGVVTHLGGSLMRPEVVDAMEQAGKYSYR